MSRIARVASTVPFVVIDSITIVVLMAMNYFQRTIEVLVFILNKIDHL